MSDLSRVFKDVEKIGSDLWHSDAGKVVVAVGVGYLTGGLFGVAGYGALAGAGYGLSSVQSKTAYERAEALQSKQIAAQRRQIELAGQQYTLTEEQMQFQMGQRQIGMLADLFLEQDRTEPRIVTLPTSREQPGIIDRINLWMESALRA